MLESGVNYRQSPSLHELITFTQSESFFIMCNNDFGLQCAINDQSTSL